MKTLLLAVAILPITAISSGEFNYCPNTYSHKKIVEVKVSPKDVKCLAMTIYGEARGEPEQGMIAVGYTVVNRAINKSVCKVALEPMQYSVYNDNPTLQWAAQSLSPKAIPPKMNTIDRAAWKQSLAIADAVLHKWVVDPTNGATHYISPVAMKALGYKDPPWVRSFELAAVIDNHVFYKQKVLG